MQGPPSAAALSPPMCNDAFRRLGGYRPDVDLVSRKLEPTNRIRDKPLPHGRGKVMSNLALATATLGSNASPKNVTAVL
jgi:hypothetical protein